MKAQARDENGCPSITLAPISKANHISNVILLTTSPYYLLVCLQSNQERKKSEMKIEIRRSANNQYYVRLVAGNNKIVADTETYVSKQGAQHAAELLKREAAAATIVDLT